MKTDPEGIRILADDLQWLLRKHDDTCKHHPDIQTDIVKLRDRVRSRYEQVTERSHEDDVFSHPV